MTYRPARRLADIEPFHVVELFTRARQLEAEGRDVIHMEVGEPDFPTPAPIANAAVNAINSGKTFYTEALGLPALREAIANFYATKYGLTVAASRIVVTNGASGALNLALWCLSLLRNERGKNGLAGTVANGYRAVQPVRHCLYSGNGRLVCPILQEKNDGRRGSKKE